MRLGDAGKEIPVAIDDAGQAWNLSTLTPDIDGRFLETDWVTTIDDAVAGGVLEPWQGPVDGSGARVGAPISRPGSVICIGMNYAAHAAESGSAPPTEPVVFFKHPASVVGPFDDVWLPPGAERLDWEVELGVVIGRRTRRLRSPADAAACIAGYVVSHDVSERRYQLEAGGTQWSKGKCYETWNPVGPWLVPASEFGTTPDLALRSWVGGGLRQDSRTGDMIFDVATIVWELSQFMTLEPGDLVNTGTPEGVALSGRFPYLRAGDVVELEIEGIGRQRQTIIEDPDA